jgi:predicted DNA-binding transcriptional regulator AlpA
LATSVRSIWRYRSSGHLPKPVQVGQGAIRWRQSDIEQWIALGCPDRKTFEAMQEARGG